MKNNRGYSVIGLYNPKNPINVGHVMRAAACFETSSILIEGRRTNKWFRAPTDVQKTYRHTPCTIVNSLKENIPYNCVPVAVDIIEGAQPLDNFVHPERAMYIFGPEDGTLGKRITDWCPYKIFIPAAYCLNLAMAVNIILYDRYVKLKRRQ